MDSVTSQPISEQTKRRDATPHRLHLAIHFTDRDTGRLVDYSFRMARGASLEVETDSIIAKLEPAIRSVLERAAEHTDATITVALLKQG